MDHLEGFLPLQNNKINNNEVYKGVVHSNSEFDEGVARNNSEFDQGVVRRNNEVDNSEDNCVKLDVGVQSLTLGTAINTPGRDASIDDIDAELDNLQTSHTDKTLDLISEDFTDEEDYRSTPTEVHQELSKIFEETDRGEHGEETERGEHGEETERGEHGEKVTNIILSDDINTLDSGYNSSLGEQDKSKSTMSARASSAPPAKSPRTPPDCNGALSPRSKRLLFSPENHRKHVSDFRQRELEKKRCLEERRKKQNEELERKKQAILKKHDEADKRIQERKSPKKSRGPPQTSSNSSTDLQRKRAFGSTSNLSSNLNSHRLRRPLSMGSLPTTQVDAARQSDVSRRSISPFRKPSQIRTAQPHTKPIIMSRTKPETKPDTKPKSRLDLSKLLKPTMTTKPTKVVEPKKEPVKKREPTVTKREPTVTKREPMKSARDRRSMPAGFKLDLTKRPTKDTDQNEVQKSTTLRRKSSLNSKSKQPCKEIAPKETPKEITPKDTSSKETLLPAKDNTPKIMNQTMQNKVHDQEAAKKRLEEARKKAREERACQEEEERLLEEERQKEIERQRVAAEEAKERMIKEKEQRRRAKEEEDRREEERLEEERREKERALRKEEERCESAQREEQMKIIAEADSRRQKDEERLTKEEEERRERQKKLDAILKRTSGNKSTITTTKREISANASAILAKHNIHIPLLANKEETESDKSDEVCDLLQIHLQETEDKTADDMSFPAPTVNSELSEAL